MTSWTDLVAPFLACAAGLPAVTLSFLLWRRTRDRSFELLTTGLGLLALIAFLLSLGIFLAAARLVSNPDLRFVAWNSTFLLAFVSLLVLRRFVSSVLPGPERPFPRLFTAVSALVYVAILVLAFALTPPTLDFTGRTVYAVSAVYYLGGFAGPAWRLWRSRSRAPSWLAGVFARAPLVLGVPVSLLAVWEVLRWAGVLPADSPALGPLAFVFLFGDVARDLFAVLMRGPEASSHTSGALSADEARVVRITARCVAAPLTAREREILRLLLAGWRNSDIARRLGLSPNTVKNHVYNVYQKTGAANRVELLRMSDAQGESPSQ